MYIVQYIVLFYNIEIISMLLISYNIIANVFLLQFFLDETRISKGDVKGTIRFIIPNFVVSIQNLML